MNKSFEITYHENGVLKTLIRYGRNPKQVESDFINLYGNIVEFVNCERVEYFIRSIRANIPFEAEVYVKIRTSIKGSQIIEAMAWGSDILEYIEANHLETLITRHNQVAPALLEHLEQIRLEEAIEDKPIIYIKQVAA